MSLKFMVKAFSARVGGTPLTKLVLLKLADNADDKGICYPSYRHIADQCECSSRAVITHVKKLEQAGFIEVLKRGSAATHTANTYRLTICNGASEQISPAGNSNSKEPSEQISLADSLASEPDSPSSENDSPLPSEPFAHQPVTLSNLSLKQADTDGGGREIFPMFAEWRPDIPEIKFRMLKTMGITQTIIEEELQKYIFVKVDTQTDKRTQHRWSTCFMSSLMRYAAANQKRQDNIAKHAVSDDDKTPAQLNGDKLAQLKMRVSNLRGVRGVDYKFDRNKPTDVLEREINDLEFKAQMESYGNEAKQ